MKLNIKSILGEFKAYVVITIGLLCYVLGWDIFLLPNSMVGGGVTGIAAVLLYAFGIPVSYSFFVINLILLLIITAVTGTFVTVLTYCITVYIKEKIAPDLQATTLNLLYALGMGVSKTLAGFVGGILTEHLGFVVSILICSGLMFVMFLLSLKNKKALQ